MEMESAQTGQPEVISLGRFICYRLAISGHDVAERLVGVERAKRVTGDEDQVPPAFIGADRSGA